MYRIRDAHGRDPRETGSAPPPDRKVEIADSPGGCDPSVPRRLAKLARGALELEGWALALGDQTSERCGCHSHFARSSNFMKFRLGLCAARTDSTYRANSAALFRRTR